MDANHQVIVIIYYIWIDEGRVFPARLREKFCTGG